MARCLSLADMILPPLRARAGLSPRVFFFRNVLFSTSVVKTYATSISKSLTPVNQWCSSPESRRAPWFCFIDSLDNGHLLFLSSRTGQSKLYARSTERHGL